jgi:hypothetical protein
MQRWRCSCNRFRFRSPNIVRHKIVRHKIVRHKIVQLKIVRHKIVRHKIAFRVTGAQVSNFSTAWKQGCQIFLDATYQNGKIYISNDHKINPMAIKYTNIFHCKTLPNYPNWHFWIWQPCSKAPSATTDRLEHEQNNAKRRSQDFCCAWFSTKTHLLYWTPQTLSHLRPGTNAKILKIFSPKNSFF